MKKYFLSMIAIVMAIGFSSFTTTPKPKGETNQLLYWYLVNSDMTTVDPESEVSGEPLTKSEAQAIVTCAGSTANDCARGYSQPLQSQTTSIGTDRIKRNN